MTSRELPCQTTKFLLVLESDSLPNRLDQGLGQADAHVGFDLCDIRRVDRATKIYVLTEI